MTMDQLKDSPQFYDISEKIRAALGSRIIIAYNSDFDMRLYMQSLDASGGFLPHSSWEDAMPE